jgi:hypothetical protein
MDKITLNRKQLSQEELVFRQEQLPREESPPDRLVANTIGKKRQPKDQRTLLENLSEAKHTVIDIPAPSEINSPKKSTSLKRGAGFGFKSNREKNKPLSTNTKQPSSFPASQSSSYTAYLNEISTQRLASIANHKILYIEDSETIKSNIEANRRLLWRTLVQDPALESLAKATLTEYLNARPADDKQITFTFPPENETTRRVIKKVTPASIEKLQNDSDIQMSVLLAKAKTNPELRITKDLNLKNILQIIDHMAYISAWKDDSKMANYQHNEPELRQVLDCSIRSTQVQEIDEIFPGITTLLSPEILEEKKDLEDKTYQSVIPLEEMFKKPSIISPNNLSEITKAFKNFSGLDLAKDKLLDIYSVPVDPDKPQWPNSSYIRTYLNNGSLERIAYMEPRLSDTRRPNSVRAEGEDEAASGQKLSAVNNYTSTVVNENIADAQKLLSDLFNPDLYSEKQNASIAEACKNFETQYPSIATNPLILINNDKYCNSGVIQYLCFNERFDEASEAFKRAMPKLKNKEDKEFLENVVLSLATNSDNLTIKLCVLIPQISSDLKKVKVNESFTLAQDTASCLNSLMNLIAEKPELNKNLIERLEKEPRKNSEDCLLVFDIISLFYKYQTDKKLFDKNLQSLIQKIQGEIIYHKFNEEVFNKNRERLANNSDSMDINLSGLNVSDTYLGQCIGSLKDFDISHLYSRKTQLARIDEGIKTGKLFTQEEIHQSIKEYYKQGDNYQPK